LYLRTELDLCDPRPDAGPSLRLCDMAEAQELLPVDLAVEGAEVSRHLQVDRVSYSGPASAGIKVGDTAAQPAKRVCLKTGAKSANIVLQDANLEKAALEHSVRPFQQLSVLPCAQLDARHSQFIQVLPHLPGDIGRMKIGAPTTIRGPIVHARQYDSFQHLIQIGLDTGAHLATGGPGRFDGVHFGFFCKTTVFSGVTRDGPFRR
jgi:aldehyde dehydrogenase (NAD+)